jgi:hypothetical protein
VSAASGGGFASGAESSGGEAEALRRAYTGRHEQSDLAGPLSQMNFAKQEQQLPSIIAHNSCASNTRDSSLAQVRSEKKGHTPYHKLGTDARLGL